MKILIVLLSILLHAQILYAFGMVNGCGQVCYNETQYYTAHFNTVRDIPHHEEWVEERLVTKFYKANDDGPKHDCLNYKKWDEIADSTKNGEKTGYKLENNKLFTEDGKRYLRCNDPDNPANKKFLTTWLEKYIVTHDWIEHCLEDNIMIFSFNSIKCYPVASEGGHHYGNGHDNPHDCPPTAPVPEPTTMLLFGTGIVCLCYKECLRLKNEMKRRGANEEQI